MEPHILNQVLRMDHYCKFLENRLIWPPLRLSDSLNGYLGSVWRFVTSHIVEKDVRRLSKHPAHFLKLRRRISTDRHSTTSIVTPWIFDIFLFFFNHEIHFLNKIPNRFKMFLKVILDYFKWFPDMFSKAQRLFVTSGTSAKHWHYRSSVIDCHPQYTGMVRKRPAHC